MRRNRTRERGFTLVEGLVAVGVILLQIALLMPALGRARIEVRALRCLHNLRQWGVATSAYVMDHEDRLPPEGAPNPGENDTRTGWYIQLPPEIGLAPYHRMTWRTNAEVAPGSSTWLCPANPRRSNGRNLFHYCLNQEVDGAGVDDAPVRWSALREPARLVWLFDSRNLPAVGTWRFVAGRLHGTGAQFLFLDGHAARVRADEVRDADGRRIAPGDGALRWRP